MTTKHTPTPLYRHRTDGGAEYLMDTFIECPNGHREGVFKNASIVVRLDGQPEISCDAVNNHDRLVEENKALQGRINTLEQIVEDLERQLDRALR